MKTAISALAQQPAYVVCWSDCYCCYFLWGAAAAAAANGPQAAHHDRSYHIAGGYVSSIDLLACPRALNPLSIVISWLYGDEIRSSQRVRDHPSTRRRPRYKFLALASAAVWNSVANAWRSKERIWRRAEIEKAVRIICGRVHFATINRRRLTQRIASAPRDRASCSLQHHRMVFRYPIIVLVVRSSVRKPSSV